MLNFLYSPTLTFIHDYWKTIGLTRWTFVGRVMSLLYKTLSRSDIAFCPRSKSLLILWLQSPSAVILEHPPQKKSVTVSIVSPSICHEVMGPDAMILVSECWALSQLFQSPLSLSSRGSLLSAIRVVSYDIWGYCYFSQQSWFQSVLDPVDVGNLISGSSAFSKTSLNIWKFTVRIAEAWLGEFWA